MLFGIEIKQLEKTCFLVSSLKVLFLILSLPVLILGMDLTFWSLLQHCELYIVFLW